MTSDSSRSDSTDHPDAAADDGGFSHLDESGRARMVDVGGKPTSRREAHASCRILMSGETVARLSELPKGDALAVARVAGIQAAKRTPEWIPLAHPLPLDEIAVDFSLLDDGVRIDSRVSCHARTGAEMEALTACAAAALTLYDMVKAVEKGAQVTDLRLESKSGGVHGDFRRAPEERP